MTNGFVLVCRDASAPAVISNLLLAMEASKSGLRTGVLFTEEAVVAMCQGVFDWPRQLEKQPLRLAMADNAAALGIPTMGGKGEARQIDVRQLVARAAEAGVPLYASAVWLRLTGLQDRLPTGITVLDMAAAIEMLRQSRAAPTA